jgi:esterase/lipase superfamily enzyme
VKRQYGKLWSAALGREMEHLVFGHAGAPVLVFPTSKGRFYQWEDFHMIAVLREHLERGWLQLFCVDSVDDKSWYNFEDHQRIQLEWHLAYETYLIDEFLPWLGKVNSTPFLILAGASFGAFHAVNFALRFPHLARRVVAMSGDYRSQKYVEGYYDEDVLANSPLDYLTSLPPRELASETQRVEFRLAAGRWDFCMEPTVALSHELERLGVPQQCHIWDDPGAHDWPLWRRQVLHYL